MNKSISNIYNLIQELSWYFGNQGFNGQCCEDLSLIEYMAVKKVYENKNITIQEIGNMLNITKSGVSKIVDRIENKGYIVRVKSPVDGRVCCVRITESGKGVINKIEKKYSLYIEEMLKGFEPNTVDDINSSLEILVDSVHKQGFIE